MEIMNQILDIENRIKGILGDNENIRKKKYEKARMKVEKFKAHQIEKLEIQKKKIKDSALALEEREMNLMEEKHYKMLQNLKSNFAINKDKWVWQIFNEIFPSSEEQI